MIEAMNASGAPILAVDLPSGIHGSSGEVLAIAVRATRTTTFFRRKPGHLLLPGRLHCGPVEVADIGIPDSVLDAVKPRIFANGPSLWSGVFPVPRIDGHKYKRGHAVVVSGGLASTGAARLAARGALRAGAGLVTIASPADALAVNAAASLSIMVRQVDDAAGLSALLGDRRLNAIVLGPGGGVGPALREMVLAALESECAVVLDADALTSFADSPETLFSAIKRRRSATILTPHDGEFVRLFKYKAELSDKSSKHELVGRASAALWRHRPAERRRIASWRHRTGGCPLRKMRRRGLRPADPATCWPASSAGLLAQGMPAFEAVSAAVWLHGEAGNAVGPGLIAEDLPDALRGVYRQLFVDLGA